MSSESTNIPTTKQSFTAAISGLVAGPAGTDILTIVGAANRLITINRIIVSGIASAASAVPVSIIKRSTLNTGGTATVVPSVAMDSRDPAGSVAVVSAYTANPATLGTTVGAIAVARVILSSTTASVGINPSMFDFERMYKKLPNLNNASELIALNYGGSTAAGNSLDISIEWTEERI